MPNASRQRGRSRSRSKSHRESVRERPGKSHRRTDKERYRGVSKSELRRIVRNIVKPVKPEKPQEEELDPTIQAILEGKGVITRSKEERDIEGFLRRVMDRKAAVAAPVAGEFDALARAKSTGNLRHYLAQQRAIHAARSGVASNYETGNLDPAILADHKRRKELAKYIAQTARTPAGLIRTVESLSFGGKRRRSRSRSRR